MIDKLLYGSVTKDAAYEGLAKKDLDIIFKYIGLFVQYSFQLEIEAIVAALVALGVDEAIAMPVANAINNRQPEIKKALAIKALNGSRLVDFDWKVNVCFWCVAYFSFHLLLVRLHSLESLCYN